MANISSLAVNSDARRSAFVVHPGGTVGFRQASVTLATADGAAASVHRLIPVFKGERLLDLTLIATDLGTGNPSRLDVGYAGDHDDVTADGDAFIDNSNVGVDGGIARATLGLNHVFAQDDTLTVTIAAAATAPAAATITLIAYLGGTA